MKMYYNDIVKHRYYLLFLLFAVIGLFAVRAAEASTSFQFTRNLWLGSVGEDVRQLQIMLNESVKTRVATYGPGSPGNETTYFGSLTAAAVSAFQELHASKVLTPIGLTKGTGYFGGMTRAAMNSGTETPAPAENTLLPTEPASVPSVTTTTTPAFDDSAITDPPVIAYPSEYVAKAGDRITVTGENFLALNNTLRFGTYEIKNVRAASAGAISFIVPSDAPDGKYNMTVSNKNGESNPRLFIIKNSSVPAPAITSVTPTSGPYGSTVTLTGYGFATNGNDIYSTFDLIPDLSSDGKTIRFTVAPFKDVPELQAGLQPKQPLNVTEYFYVVNKNGISNVETFVIHFE